MRQEKTRSGSPERGVAGRCFPERRRRRGGGEEQETEKLANLWYAQMQNSPNPDILIIATP